MGEVYLAEGKLAGDVMRALGFADLMYEMLAGRLPFESATASDMIASILRSDPPSLAKHSPQTPAEFEAIVTPSRHLLPYLFENKADGIGAPDLIGVW
jgi:hypothetical protein